MNKLETIQDLIDHLSSLPRSIKQSPVLSAKGVSGSEYTSLSDTSFMYVDKSYDSGYTDELWEEDDLVGPGESPEEAADILDRFKKVLVLWFD